MPESEDNQRGAINVLVCLGEDVLDRVGVILRHVLVGLVDQGISIRLASSDARIDDLALGPIRTLHYEPLTAFTRRHRIKKLAELLRSSPPSIIHAVSWPSFAVSAALAEALDAELVLHVTSLQDCERLLRISPSDVAHVIVVSEPLRNVVIEQLRLRPAHVTLVRPGLSVANEPTCFASPHRRVTLLSTSSFTREGGVERLIAAMDMIRSHGRDVLAFLMGGGPKEPDLRGLVREHGLTASVMFAEPLQDVAAAMHGADIFVRPNSEPTFAFNGLQAMALGLAVVTFPDALNDHFQAGKTAYVCGTPTARGLADCILDVLTDPARARSTAANAIGYIRTHHSMSEMAERTAAIYRALALPRTTFSLGARA